MSFYLVNPGGRIVAVETEGEYERWLNTRGFKAATEAQKNQHIKERTELVNKQKAAKEENGLEMYLATVSQGGKDGYGVASAKIMGELRRLGVNVETYNTGQRVGMLLHNPYSILRIDSAYRILYTMFESDKIPDDWKDYLEAADMLLTPSQWCASIFKKYADVDPVVVPLGYDHNVYKFYKRPLKRKQRKDFVFLHYNAFNARKGFLELFKAWNKAFQKDEPVKLILKTTLTHPPLPITKDKYPNIIIETGKWPEEKMLDLMYKSDAFVFPSRGEGFGMTPLEAMATGLPTIVPNAHGISEYFSPRFMYEVKVKEKCPALYSRYKDQDVGSMVVCDVDHLAQQMRYIYEHQADARKRGEAAAKYVQKWTFENTAKKIKGLLEGINSAPLPERPLRNVLQLKKI